MRRIACRMLAALAVLAAAAPAGDALAQPPPAHAWLFGTWTGGIFPAPPNLAPQACLSQPVVVFTRDLVMRATLTEQTLTQRVIETARITPQGMEFRFAAAPSAPACWAWAAPGRKASAANRRTC